MDQTQLIQKFKIFTTPNQGIESSVSADTAPLVVNRLLRLDEEPLSKVQLNQLLGMQGEIGVSDGFFSYYWTSHPKCPYKLSSIPGFSDTFQHHDKIQNLDHLLYGLYRIFIDGLLYRGNVRGYFRDTAPKSFEELDNAVTRNLVDTPAIKKRGPSLPLNAISRDNRYLISEMACKSYGEMPRKESELKDALLESWLAHESSGGGAIKIKDLLSQKLKATKYSKSQGMLEFSADDILDDEVSSKEDIEARYQRIADAFIAARASALENTTLYLSLVNDLDVYVATSMRTREHFRSMADRCDKIFSDSELTDLHVRYFDPTMSAADGHQDKGLIECLMVKCAKVLVYCAGDKESFGKDAEAAMALSLGKPVIFLCDEGQRESFYRDVHPLSRLINFDTGVAVGAMVTCKVEDVSELLKRIFNNEMEYFLVQPTGRPGYLQLTEKLTESVVRLQTNNTLLSEAFWNYYKGHH